MSIIPMICPECGGSNFQPTIGQGSRNYDEMTWIDGAWRANPMIMYETEFNNQCSDCDAWSVYDSDARKHVALLDPTDVSSARVDA